MQINYRTHLLAISLISLITGCSSAPNVVPDTGPSTLDVYKSHMNGTSSQPKMYRQLRNDRRDLAKYTRDVSNEINLKFPKLPNPELVMYIFPHMTSKGRPVPGYSTSFMMYEKDEYAMPGEIAP